VQNFKLVIIESTIDSRAVVSNPNGLLSQNICHCLDQGRTLNDILLRPRIEWLTLILVN